MAKTSTLFDKLAPRYMDELMADFAMAAEDAAAVMGSAGHESNGFRLMQEVKPLGGGRGGLGPFQWTGPRRRTYEAWLKRKGAKPGDFETDYGFLFRELTGPEAKAVPATMKAAGLEAKVKAFELAFERAGVKHYESRIVWAKRALTAWQTQDRVEMEKRSPTAAPAVQNRAGEPAPPVLPPPTASSPWVWLKRIFGYSAAPTITPVPAAVSKGEPTLYGAQKRLVDLGYTEVGMVDGRWGTKTRAALILFRDEQAESISIPKAPPLSDELLAALAKGKPRSLSHERVTATASDLRAAGSTPVKSFDALKPAGWASLVLGIFGGADQTGVLDSVKGAADQATSTIQSIQTVVSGVLTAFQWALQHLWIFAIAGGLYVLWSVAMGILNAVVLFRQGILGQASR